MELPQLPDLKRLTAARGVGRLSIFMSLPHDGSRRDKTRIRAKNLLRGAGQTLRLDGMRPDEVDHVIDAAQEVLDDVQATPSTSTGLAIFVAPDGARHFQIPMRLPNLVLLGDRFTVGPLLPLFTVDGTYFVLALNQDEIRLFRGTRRGMDQLELDGCGLAAWQTMPLARPTQVHAFVADRGGARSRAVFHGGGAGGDDWKALVARHYRGVDRALREVLVNSESPLVLAAVRNMQSLYREVNTYPHLIRHGVDGSPRGLGLKELHRRAWPLVEPVLRVTEAATIARFNELRGTGHAVNGPANVLAAAEHGRVQTLLLCAEACTWADFPNDHGLARLTDGGRVEEQLELAALATIRHGGEFYVIPGKRMPVSTLVGATLRY